MPANILPAEEVENGIDRLNKIKAAEPGIFVEFEIVFLPDHEWDDFLEEWLEDVEGELNSKYAEHIRKDARAFTQNATIFMKQSAKKDKDFNRLLLHELGHSIGLTHTNRVGDIMNPYRNNWYGMTAVPKESDHIHELKLETDQTIIEFLQDNDNFYKSSINLYTTLKCTVEGCDLDFTADGELQPGNLENGIA